MQKTTCIIGAGVSGVIAAISEKRNHPERNVFILEHTDTALRKLLATGNGRCNIGNTELNIEDFSNNNFAGKILEDYSLDKYLNFLDSLHIKTKTIGNLLYPITESSQTVRTLLLNALAKLNVPIYYNVNVKDYTNNGIFFIATDSKTYTADKLILCIGGKVLPKSGSDASFYNILINHQYLGIVIKPGLTPIIVEEKLRDIDGVRVKANVSLYANEQLIHKEAGEVLFRDYGLSGIVIMNISRYIARDMSKDYKISIDMLPMFEETELDSFDKLNGRTQFLYTFLHPKLVKYVEKYHQNDSIVNFCKNVTFNFKGFPGYDVAQISIGGVNVNEVNDDLSSKIENNVYLAGEMLDVDGPCGGYNLTWAIWSAMKTAIK